MSQRTSVEYAALLAKWTRVTGGAPMGATRGLGGPGAVPMHQGFPFPEALPAMALAEATRSMLEREASSAQQYSGGPSAQYLAEWLRGEMQQRRVWHEGDALVLTQGGSEALGVIGRAFLDLDDVLAVEGPTFMGALAQFRNWTNNIVRYPMDEQGLIVDAVAADLQRRRQSGERIPKLLYTIPTHQNPTGCVLPLQRRQQLLALAEEYNFLMIEDDAYSGLSWGEPPPPPIRSLGDGSRVIYVGTLSKLVAPAHRIGWLLAPAPLATALTLSRMDGGAWFSWGIVGEFLRQGGLSPQRIAWLAGEYQRRCAATLSALERYMPGGCSWSRPQGGFFIWLRLPPGVSSTALLPVANALGAAFIPGPLFFADGGGDDGLRLAFSWPTPEDLDRGIAALAQAIGQLLG